jgi:hypothetical protein
MPPCVQLGHSTQMLEQPLQHPASCVQRAPSPPLWVPPTPQSASPAQCQLPPTASLALAAALASCAPWATSALGGPPPQCPVPSLCQASTVPWALPMTAPCPRAAQWAQTARAAAASPSGAPLALPLSLASLAASPAAPLLASTAGRATASLSPALQAPTALAMPPCQSPARRAPSVHLQMPAASATATPAPQMTSTAQLAPQHLWPFPSLSPQGSYTRPPPPAWSQCSSVVGLVAAGRGCRVWSVEALGRGSPSASGARQLAPSA